MTDIQKALDAIAANLPMRQRYCDYYDGNHNLAFATEKFKTAFGRTLKGMRDNLCPIVVEAPADRMEVINFAGEDEDKEDAVAEKAWALWQRELMECESFHVHVEAIKTGAAYLIVWPDPETNEAKFYLQDSRNCVVIEDAETSKPLFGAKEWKTDEGKIRLTLYYADRIEKYITIKKPSGTLKLKPEHFEQYEESVENPYGVVPMFLFETKAILEDAIPLQDVLNKTLADRMVSQEFAAFRQRWITGVAPPIDELTGKPAEPFKAGADRIWFTDEEDATFGEFGATDLTPFLTACDADRLEMARISGTPLHFFSINTSDAISGKALKALESRFTKRVTRLTLNFGAVWSRAMKLALQIEKTTVTGALTAQWDSPETRDEQEFLDTLLQKQDLGIPQETLWEEYGYSKEDIAKFDTEPEPDPAVIQAQMMPNGMQPVQNGNATTTKTK